MNKFFITFLTSLFFLSGCMKETIDPPANPKDPNITSNYTIYDLKQDFKASGQTIWTINQDKVIEAIVSANDVGGNFYEEIVIQDKDNKAAIGVLINRSNLYNDFPVGRKVFLKVKGMAMAIQNNLVVLGGYIDTTTVPGAKSLGQLPPTAIDKTILKGSINNEVRVDEITMSQLSETYHYKLIRFKDVEFKCEDTKFAYADAVNLRDANRTLLDKNGNDVLVRTSGYSNFAAAKVASGKGTLTGVFTVYRNDFQIKLRDINDVSLNDSNRTTPCAGSGGGGGTGGGGTGGTFTPKTIAEIRAMFTGSPKQINAFSIEGIVISDKTNANVNSRNIVVQDASGRGIVVRFGANNTFNLGDKVKVNITNDSLSTFNGVLQLGGSAGILATDASLVSSGNTITPTTVTIATINSNIDLYESTLVKIVNATFGGGSTYNGTSGKTSLSDGANIDHYTLSSALFKGDALPTGPKTVTAIVSKFNSTRQLSIRNTSDVQ
jgi:DNA/RNA endonuclease YhcR with UshA esterase domain